MMLSEKYRPATWSDVVGQDAAVKKIREIVARDGWGKSFWFFIGKSGVGKTALANLLALEGASPEAVDGSYDTPITAGDETSPAFFRAWAKKASQYGWGKGGRALIINEVHGLPAHSIRELKGFLEGLRSHWCVIFTSTPTEMGGLFENETEESFPMLSRCQNVVRLCGTKYAPTSDAFVKRAMEIAQAEHLDGRPVESYRAALDGKAKGSLRELINLVGRKEIY